MRQIIMGLVAMLLTCCSSENSVMAEPVLVEVGEQESETSNNMAQKLYLTIDGVTKSATLESNTATKELTTRLQQAPVTVSLNSSGGFEIWGSLGFSLPTSNEQINAGPGDMVLYNGSNICIFYGTNSWSYTRLGKIDGLLDSELQTFLKAGERNIQVTLSLTEK
jgi:hypothetical protein